MLYYVGTYRTENVAERKALGSVAEDVKMAYIISTIKLLKQSITVVSVLSSLKMGFHHRKTCRVDELETQVFLESYDSGNVILAKIGVVQRLAALFFYLFFHAKKSDTIIVYNTQLFSVPVRLAKFFKKFGLVLEVEEIFYLDDQDSKAIKRKLLEVALINAAESYIFASDLLAERVSDKKQYAVAYGSYTVPRRRVTRKNDGNIHVVYAGGIDALRRVDYAVQAFRLLPYNYRLHILGHGTEQDIEKLQRFIFDTNRAVGFDKTEYVGSLYGDQYDEYLEACHIGLNMQIINTSIEDVAFPSKISSYFGRGLSVVSGSLSSIKSSPFADNVKFFDENIPEKIAQAIRECNIQPYEQQVKLVVSAENRFISELQQLLNEI